jgi:SAM-dependent methyltransferase
VVSFDLSSAVEANFRANATKGNLLLFQGSVYDMPVKDNFFDFVFCHGVLQHTPEPERSFQCIFNKVKPGGRLSIDYYLKTRRPVPWSLPKYFWRPMTTKMDPGTLLRTIKTYIPFWLPIDTVIRRVPKIGPVISALTLIPCWNYHYLPISKKDKVEWAIMDTYDALGAHYDFPKTLEEVSKMITVPGSKEHEVFYGGNGVVANLKKEENV